MRFVAIEWSLRPENLANAYTESPYNVPKWLKYNIRVYTHVYMCTHTISIYIYIYK